MRCECCGNTDGDVALRYGAVLCDDAAACLERETLARQKVERPHRQAA